MAFLDDTGVSTLTADIKALTDAAYVAKTDAASATPKMNIAGAVGTAIKFAREDHAHPPIYGTCDTAANTAAKVVTCSNFTTPTDGTIIYVRFTYGNATTSSVTLNVNSTGAKTVQSPDGTSISGTNLNYIAWANYEIVGFMYRSTNSGYWAMLTPPRYDTGVDGSFVPAKFTRGTLYLIEKRNLQQAISVILPNVSDSNRSFSVTGITPTHTLIQEGCAYISNPSAVGSDLTLTTGAGTVTVAGTLTGTTNIQATFVAGIGTAVTGTAVT